MTRSRPHLWTMLVAYELPEEELPATDWSPDEHTIAYVLGPGCRICRMTFEECAGRSCPGERPEDLDQLRDQGSGHLAGLSRSERRRIAHNERRAQRRGRADTFRPPSSSLAHPARHDDQMVCQGE